MIKFSIIIPTANRSLFLDQALDSLVNLSFPNSSYEIIVVDNNSTDNTKWICENYISTYPQYNLKYYFEPVPGLLSGRHKGATEAQGDILTFIDDDIIADKNWLSSIEEAFKDSPVHLVGGKNLPKYETDPPEWVKALFFETPYGGWQCGGLSLLDFGNELIDIDPDFVWGLNFSIRKTSLFNLGGFHPDCIPKEFQPFQGDGETGLTIKLKEKGLRAVYQPKALIYHQIPKERMTIEYFEKRYFYQGVCDSYTYIRKSQGEFNKSVYSLFNKTNILINELLKYKRNQPDNFIKLRLQKAYIQGFEFHHKSVIKSPSLLKWVLKEDYWDYDFRKFI